MRPVKKVGAEPVMDNSDDCGSDSDMEGCELQFVTKKQKGSRAKKSGAKKTVNPIRRVVRKRKLWRQCRYCIRRCMCVCNAFR